MAKKPDNTGKRWSDAEVKQLGVCKELTVPHLCGDLHEPRPEA